MDRTIVYYFVIGSAFQELLLIIFIGFLSYQEFRSARAIYLLRKQLKVGIPINHHAPLKKFSVFHTFIFYISMLFAMTCIIFPLVGMVKYEKHGIPPMDVNTPIIRLAEIEGHETLVYDHDLSADYAQEIPWLKSYTKEWSLFAPTQYESHENATIPGEAALNRNDEAYSPFIRSYIYQLRFPSWADGLVNDLVTRYTDDNDENGIGEIIEERFDKLLVREGNYSVSIFAAKDGIVYYVDYYGKTDSDTIIDLIAEKMTAFDR